MSSVNKEILVQNAILALQSERYDDMAQAMKSVAEIGEELSHDERNLLSYAYKHAFQIRRSSWRVISLIDQQSVAFPTMLQPAQELRERVEVEISEICYEVLDLLDKYLIPKASNPENEVFYLKMKGDYYRYLAEIATGDTRNSIIDDSEAAYQEGLEISMENLPATHPDRLRLALNFSVFYHDIVKCADKACQVAKQAFNNAVIELNTLDGEYFLSSKKIMKLIFYNIINWTLNTQDYDGNNEDNNGNDYNDDDSEDDDSDDDDSDDDSSGEYDVEDYEGDDNYDADDDYDDEDVDDDYEYDYDEDNGIWMNDEF